MKIVLISFGVLLFVLLVPGLGHLMDRDTLPLTPELIECRHYWRLHLVQSQEAIRLILLPKSEETDSLVRVYFETHENLDKPGCDAGRAWVNQTTDSIERANK